MSIGKNVEKREALSIAGGYVMQLLWKNLEGGKARGLGRAASVSLSLGTVLGG